ncbi:hypothetical protein GCM10010411_64710 [Actinomadura fulvescens]|uniref:Uncharacterized protein n=1 Tax=Actinomadura fulvescens TaxID=46160 RepID=A0ABP6CIT7_9ACTN
MPETAVRALYEHEIRQDGGWQAAWMTAGAQSTKEDDVPYFEALLAARDLCPTLWELLRSREYPLPADWFNGYRASVGELYEVWASLRVNYPPGEVR